jgi:hypothetical protein
MSHCRGELTLTKPFDEANPGQPITSLRWNNMQIAIRERLEGLAASKLDLTGGTLAGQLTVSYPLPSKVAGDLLRVQAPSGNVGLRVQTGATPSDLAALRFAHGDAVTAQISAAANGRLSLSDVLHVLANRVGVGVSAPQQTLHVAGRLMLDHGVIQRGGPAIVDTEELGLYSQQDGQGIRIVTRNAPVRFFGDGGSGNSTTVSVLPSGDLNVRRFVIAARLGAGVAEPQDLLHLKATASAALRIQAGAGADDRAAIRLFQDGAERAVVSTGGLPGVGLSMSTAIAGHALRYVTNGGSHIFYADAAANVANLTANKDGDLHVRRFIIGARLGAGVSDPQDLLHVRSSGGAAGLRLDAPAGASNLAVISFNSGDAQSAHIAAAEGGRLTLSNTLHVHLAANRVGIGTGVDMPQELLHLNSASSAALRVQAGGGANDQAALRLFQGGVERAVLSAGGAPGVGLSVSTAVAGHALRYVTNGGSHIFYANASVANLTIDKDGNVQLGGSLDVKAGAVIRTGSLSIGTANPSNTSLRVYGPSAADSRVGWVVAGGDQSAVVLGEYNGKAIVGGHSGGLNSWADVVLNPYAGSVGIGVNPTQRLDVNGNTMIRGGITAVGGLNFQGAVAHIEADGALYRNTDGQCYLTVDDLFYIRDVGSNSWAARFQTDSGSLTLKGGLWAQSGSFAGDVSIGGRLAVSGTVHATALRQHHDGNSGVNANLHHSLVLGDNGAWGGNYNRLYLRRDDGSYANDIKVRYADGIASSRKLKRDIVPVPEDDCNKLLDELCSVQLVRYRLQQPADEHDQDVVHLGILAEDAPDEIVSTDRASLEIGDYCAFLLAGSKALKRECDSLRGIVRELTGRIAVLESLAHTSAQGET